MDIALGLDVGTTNVKAALVGADGTVLAMASRKIVADIGAGVAELDAEAQWASVCDAVRACVAAAPDAAAGVGAVGVASQWSSIVPVDASGRPVARMRLWQDQRGTERALAVNEHEEAFFGFIERHGIPPVGGGLSLSHILHLQHDSPEVHEATAAYLEVMDYVNARLTGRIVANQATMFASQLIDNRELGRTEYDETLLGWAGVDPSRLPPLAGLAEPVGPVTDDVAADLGLPSGVTVWAGMNDTHAGAIATGVDRAGRAGLSIGTTTILIDTVAEKAVDLDHEVLTSPGPFEDAHVLLAENGLGGRSVEHVLDTLLGVGFDDVDETLARVGVGSGGVLFLPWLGGSLAPANDAAMRGGFVGVGLDTDRDALVRATFEGVAHNLAWLLPHAEALTGQSIDEVVFVGGAARSAGMAQIVADVLGRPVTVPDHPEVAIARAAGLLALTRSGTLTRAGLSSLAGGGSTSSPVSENHERYRVHQEQFEAAFEALRPISQALSG